LALVVQCLEMPGVKFERRPDGRLSIHLIGCCGDPERWSREYEQQFLRQILDEGGRVVASGPEGVEVVDRRGRTHHLDARLLSA
jgi:hypothetical protein